jgi:hypothetical protein
MRPCVRLGAGPLWATLTAGPIFGACLLVETYLKQIPQPVEVSVQDALIGGGTLLIAFVIGGLIISIIPNLLGALAVGTLAERLPAFRSPAAWGVVGACAIAGPALVHHLTTARLEEDGVQLVFALTITSTLCALICRRTTCWIDTQPIEATPQPAKLKAIDPDPRLLR